MAAFHVRLLSGDKVHADFTKVQSLEDLRTLVEASLEVPKESVQLVQDDGVALDDVSFLRVLQMGAELTAIVDSLHYLISEAKSSVLDCARQTLATRQHLALMEKVQQIILPNGGLPLLSTYSRCVASLEARLYCEILERPLFSFLGCQKHLQRESLVVPPQNELMHQTGKSICTEIDMFKEVWSMVHEFGARWLQDQLSRERARLFDEVASLDLPGLIGRLYGELMEHEQMQQREHGVWRFRDVLRELVNEELGKYSPFQDDDGASSYSGYYECDCEYCIGYHHNLYFALFWRIDVEHARWRTLQQARLQRSCTRWSHSKRLRKVERRLRKRKGGRFKPGERIVVCKDE